MKTIKLRTMLAILSVFTALTTPVHGEDAKKEKIKPYTLDACAVCGMKLADMGKPYVFDYKDREIKVCDKSEAGDFKKDPAKYIKQIEAAEAKGKAKK